MIRFFTRWRAKRRYIWKEEFESGIADLQADLAADRAKEKLKLSAQLMKEAEAIEENIRTEEATPEYQALQGKEKYEAEQEKKDAERIAASKRQEAQQEEQAAQGSSDTARMFRRQAAAGRETADRLRRL